MGIHTPLWTSADGRGWIELGGATLGSNGVVLGVYPFLGQLTALTATGDESTCDDTSSVSCWLARAPVRAWTSIDGTAWTLRAEPMNLVDNPERRDLFHPLTAANSAWIVVTNRDRDGASLATSVDGLTWQTASTPDVFVHGWADQLTAVSDRFVALVSDKEQGTNTSIFWSNNSLLWHEPSDVPAGTYDLSVLATGRNGIVVRAVSLTSEAGDGWWTSTDGVSWKVDDEFGPLGRAAGEVLPNGEVAGDGQRMVAYRFGASDIWSSVDGTEWTALASHGDLPPSQPVNDAMTVLPIGLIYRDGQGNAWFGDPAP